MSAIRSKDSNHFKYLFYFLGSIQNKLMNMGRGSTFSAITQDDLRDILIPVPPLPVQKKLTTLLDKADSIRKQHQESIRLADEFIRSTFLKMFGDPKTNPFKWPTKSFNEMLKVDRIAIQPNEIDDGEIYLGLDNIEKETGIIVNPIPYKKEFLSSTKFKFTNKHILYGKLRPYLNKVAAPNFNGVCSTDILPLLPIPKLSKRYFLIFLLRHNAFVNYVTNRSVGANLPRVNYKTIEQYKTICPPFTIQDEFERIVKMVYSLNDKFKSSLAKSENLFDLLMQKAFKGELS